MFYYLDIKKNGVLKFNCKSLCDIDSFITKTFNE